MFLTARGNDFNMIRATYHIFGKEIPAYGALLCLGAAFACLVALLICKRKGTARWDIAYSAVYTFIGAFLGAKLLFILVSLPTVIRENIPFVNLWMGGFVFYGGLIGGILGLWIYGKQFKEPIAPIAECYAAVLPLGHAFGRVGCFFGGCCFGMPHDGWFSHVYEADKVISADTPVGIPLLPVQLIEAFFLLCIFAVTITVYLKTGKRTGYTVAVYILLYAPLRFVLEFFRYDSARGVFLLSTSQWISLALLALVGVYLWRKLKVTKK